MVSGNKGLDDNRTLQKRAWLVDSSIYVFKAWYTNRNEQLDSDGYPVNATLGFIDFIYRLLAAEKPQLIAFAFDESLKTSHRKQIYPEYKANRAPAPESLRRQFKYCCQFLSYLGIHQAASSRYEADDLIATWATGLRSAGIAVNIITADKDLAQLVDKNDYWWEYAQNRKLDSKLIEKHFKARPEQIADQLAIAGDKSDNIPGVPGIGMATAGKLLKKFDNLDNLLASVDMISSMQIRGAVRIQGLIRSHQQSICLARQLTGLCCDIEPVNEKRFGLSVVDEKPFVQLCKKLGLPVAQQQKWLALRAR